MRLYSHLALNNNILEDFPFSMELNMESFITENPIVLTESEDDSVRILDYESVVKDCRAKDGRIDIVALVNEETIAIIELKNHALDNDAYKQLQDYLAKKEEIKANLISDNKLEDKEYNFVGILCGTDISGELLNKIENPTADDIKDSNSVPVEAIILNRYKSKDQIFIATKHYVSEKGKDYSKYTLGTKAYSKSRFVLEVVRQSVQKNPEITFEKLKEMFPDSVQGSSLGVVCKYAELPEKSKRYVFSKAEDIIVLNNGEEVAVCNQWAAGKNFDRFLKRIDELGIKYNKCS